MIPPDPGFVLEALRQIGRHRGAQDEDFNRAVRLRLDQGGSEYADTYRERGLTKLLDEVREEAADVAGWLILALDVAFEEEREGKLDADQAQLVRVKIVALAALGQYVWRELADVLAELDPLHFG